MHPEKLLEGGTTSNKPFLEAKQDCESSAAHPGTAGNLTQPGLC